MASRKRSENILRTWRNAVSAPRKTFGAELKHRHKLAQGAMHIVIAAVISAIIIGLSGQAGQLYGWLAPLSAGTTALFIVGLIVFAAILNTIGWLVWSGILYLIARALGGKGGYTGQSYLIAIYSAPLSILAAVVTALLGAWNPATALTAAAIIGTLIAAVIALYQLYLLTLALKLNHRYSTGRAVLTWLIPILVVLVIAALFVGFLVATLVAAQAI